VSTFTALQIATLVRTLDAATALASIEGAQAAGRLGAVTGAIAKARRDAAAPPGLDSVATVAWLANEVVLLRAELEDVQPRRDRHHDALVDLLSGFSGMKVHARKRLVEIPAPQTVLVSQDSVDTLLRAMDAIDARTRERAKGEVQG
jgi:hypothetical protein